MGALAHVLEAEGLAMVALLPSLDIAERMRPPRVLVASFPLGRPLGRPGDPGFQRGVLEAALGLLARPAGPVLEVFPEVIEDEAADALTCTIPARHDPTLPPAVDEARGLAPEQSCERNLLIGGAAGIGCRPQVIGRPGFEPVRERGSCHGTRDRARARHVRRRHPGRSDG